MRKLAFLVCCICNMFILHAQDKPARIHSGGPLKPLQEIMDIRHYTISLNVDPATETIDGFGEIELILSKATDTLLIDLTHFYTISAVTVNKKKASFTQSNDLVYITGAGGFTAGKQTVRINYAGKPPVA